MGQQHRRRARFCCGGICRRTRFRLCQGLWQQPRWACQPHDVFRRKDHEYARFWLQAACHPCSRLGCTRIVVNADLSDPSWTSKLLDAGFQPEQTSFFLLEGLMMYLPPGAPQALWRSVSSLMSSGSKIAGDSFVNVLSLWPIQHVLEKYGTKFTFEVGSKEELVQMLLNASLRDAEVLSVDGSLQQLPNDGNGDQALADARRIAGVLVSVPSWPPHALDWVRGQVAEKGGTEQVVRIVVEDKMGFHGLKDSSVEHKARVCELLFRDGWQSKLEDIVRELPASSQRSKFRKAYDAIAMMYAVMRWKMVKRRPTDAYVVYVASKA